MGKEKFIPIIALIILIIAGTSSAYVYTSQIDKETIAINGEEYTIDQIFYNGAIKTIDTVEGKKTGIDLGDLILKSGVNCPKCSEYKIKAKDSYQKTVDWNILKTGIITEEKRVFFPETAKAFWIRDVIEIEVI